MGDMLTQEEINALLSGGSSGPDDSVDAFSTEAPDVSAYVGTPQNYDDVLTGEQKDILGEIGNISMGTAATTLFALLNQKVWITTPKVKVVDWLTLSQSYDRPCVGIRVDYKEGLKGSNILILKERDVKIIADLMMGGSGDVPDDVALTELDMSAIGEAMNQMVGSSSTSLSSMIKMKIDIDTPKPFLLDFTNDDFFSTVGFAPHDLIACIAFKMEIGTLIDSEIMQILPVEFAADMVDKLKNDMMGGASAEPTPAPAAAPAPAPVAAPPPQAQAAPLPVYAQPDQQAAMPQYGPMPGYPPEAYQQPPYPQQPYPQPYPPQAYQQPWPAYQQPDPNMQRPAEPSINAKPVQFHSFDVNEVIQQKENMGIIMDVPLEITVEMGRTRRTIKDILEFAPGTIVELDRLAGEPIDVLVNGKFVAKGEVMVIDEKFCIRITDIISVDKRI